MFVRDTILDWTCCEACVAEDADFKEGEHPRNDKGEFSSGPGQAPSDLESLRLARQQAALAYEAIAGKKQPKKKVELAREALLRAAQAHNEALLTAGYDPLTGKKNRDPEAYIPRYLAWAKESGVHARLERGDGYAKELAQAFLAGAEGDKMPSLGWRREEHVAELKSAYTEGQKADPEKGAANYFLDNGPGKGSVSGAASGKMQNSALPTDAGYRIYPICICGLRT